MQTAVQSGHSFVTALFETARVDVHSRQKDEENRTDTYFRPVDHLAQTNA